MQLLKCLLYSRDTKNVLFDMLVTESGSDQHKNKQSTVNGSEFFMSNHTWLTAKSAGGVGDIALCFLYCWHLAIPAEISQGCRRG